MKQITTFLLLFLPFILSAQSGRIEDVPFGDMDCWMVRRIKESAVIGGNTRYLYEITPGDTLVDVAYKNTLSPWATSSVLAKVSGITKASVTVFPEERDGASVPGSKPVLKQYGWQDLLISMYLPAALSFWVKW